MDRRDALKRTALIMGYSFTGVGVATLIQSCATDKSLDSWTPKYLGAKEVKFIAELAETILPTTETPGAKDLQVERFIDLVYGMQFPKQMQAVFDREIYQLQEKTQASAKKPFVDCSPEERSKVIEEMEKEGHGFRMSVWGRAVGKEKPVSFYRKLKQMIIAAYFSSEEIGTEHLHYVPVPGKQEGCIDLANLDNQNSYSL